MRTSTFILLATLSATLSLTPTLGCGDSDATDPPDAVSLPGEALYPEGIAATADGTFYVGSLREGTIWRVPPGAGEPEAAPFAAAGANGLVSALGLLADEERGLLWACSSDPGVGTRTGEDPPAVVAFDLATGAASGRFELPGGGFCNDLALDGAGNLYVTDSFGPRVLLLAAGADALEVWLEDEAFAGEGFNLNGIAVESEAVYTVKYNSGELFRIPIAADGSPGGLASIALDRVLELPDGLKLEGPGRLVVVEGAGRLSRILVDGDTGAVSTIRDQLDGPTTVALHGGDAWVVEGKLGHLFDQALGDPALPFQVVRVPLD
jgi:sugar lactone lactonase YvrE